MTMHGLRAEGSEIRDCGIVGLYVWEIAKAIFGIISSEDHSCISIALSHSRVYYVLGNMLTCPLVNCYYRPYCSKCWQG